MSEGLPVSVPPWKIDFDLAKQYYLNARADEDLESGTFVVWTSVRRMGAVPVASVLNSVWTGTVRASKDDEVPHGVTAGFVRKGSVVAVWHERTSVPTWNGSAALKEGLRQRERVESLQMEGRILRSKIESQRIELEATVRECTARASESDRWRGEAERLQAELATVRESNVRLREERDSFETEVRALEEADQSLVRDSNELRALWLAVAKRFTTCDDAALRAMNARPETLSIFEAVQSARRHHCKPPLGNPTREEAIAALREIAGHADRGPRDYRMNRIREIASTALPETQGPGANSQSAPIPDAVCAWPECRAAAIWRSGNFGNLLVCSMHFEITNGPANAPHACGAVDTLREIQRKIAEYYANDLSHAEAYMLVGVIGRLLAYTLEPES